MAITPQNGYVVDPNNPNGVISLSPQEYQKAGGTLVNGNIPTSRINPVTNQIVSQTPQEAFSSLRKEPIEPTVISGDKTQTIIDNNNKVAGMGINGNITGADAYERYSSGEWANAPSGSTKDANGVWTDTSGKKYYLAPDTTEYANPDNKKTADLLEQIKSQTDAIFAEQISAVQAQYQNLIKQQEDINKRQEAGMAQGLLTSGASRYTNIGEGVMAGQQSYGIQQIADLQSKENSAIASLKSAQAQKDYELMDKQLTLIQKIKDEKQKAVNDLQEKMTKQANDLRDYSRKIQEQTTKDINEVLTVAREANAPADVIDKIIKSKTLAGAITNAGIYGAKSTNPMVSEFYAYLRDAKEKRVSAVGFLDFQKQYEINLQNAKTAKTTISPSGNLSVTGLTDEQSKILQSKGLTATQAENVAGIYNGLRPPLSGFGVNSKEGMAVTAGLNALGYNLTKATEDWDAILAWTKTVNSSKIMTATVAADSANQYIKNLRDLSSEWDAGRFPPLNWANFKAALDGLKGIKQQELAQKIQTQIADLQSDMASVYRYGLSSTDSSMKTAAETLSTNWGNKRLGASLDIIENNLKIRINSLRSTKNILSASGSKNPYIGTDKGTGTGDKLIQDEQDTEAEVKEFGMKNPAERTKILQMRKDNTWTEIKNYYKQ